MSCATTITRINPAEYIGNSLDTINANFANLRDGINNNCNTLLSATTIVSNVQAISNTLQQYSQGRVKAWVTFDGEKAPDANDPTIGVTSAQPGPRYFVTPAYNIEEVYKVERGIYEIYFAEELIFPEPENPLLTYPYGVLVTSEAKQATGGKYTWAQPILYAADYVAIAIHDGQASPNYIDPSRVTVAII